MNPSSFQFPVPIVAVAIIDDLAQTLPLADALIEAGVPQIEVTLRTPVAMDAIKLLRQERPDFIVGAGTILDPTLVEPLMDLGVAFGVTPGLDERVVSAALARDWPLFSGVMTPTEVIRAISLGLKTLKFFPAEAAGGVKMLKALAGPYAHTGVKFMPTGGITAANVADYLALPVTAAIGGSWFVAPKLVKAGDFAAVTKLAAEAREIAAKI